MRIISGKKNTRWLNPHPVLDFFDKPVGPEFKKFNNYKEFVEKYDAENENNVFLLNIDLTLEKKYYIRRNREQPCT